MIYKDKIQKNQYPALGEYSKSFNKLCPKQVEVNEVTVDDVICYSITSRNQNQRWSKPQIFTRPLVMTLILAQRNRQLTLHSRKINDYMQNMNPMHTSALYKAQYLEK